MTMQRMEKQPMKSDVRIALLEQTVEHIGETLQRLDARFDRLEEKMDLLFSETVKKIEKLDCKVDKVTDQVSVRLDKLNERIWTNHLWILSTMFTLACAAGGAMAKGFGWI